LSLLLTEKNDESRRQEILTEIQNRKVKSLERELEREKTNTPLKKAIKYSVAGIVSIFFVIIVIAVLNMPSSSGYQVHANLIATHLAKALPTGNIENIKTLLTKSDWENTNNNNSRNIFVAYKTLGEYKSHTKPQQQHIKTVSSLPYISIALYQSVAQFEEGPAEILLNVAKISNTEFKLVNFQVNSEVFTEILHNKAVKRDK